MFDVDRDVIRSQYAEGWTREQIVERNGYSAEFVAEALAGARRRRARPGPEDDGDPVLDDVEAFVRRLVALPSESAAVAFVLWVAHSHGIDYAESSPRLAFLSPEPASGKTRALEVLETLVPAPMAAVNATPAALFRAVSDLEHRPTILFDEIDSVFGPKAKEHEELRGLLNAGHRRSGAAYRCVGEGTRQKVVKFPAYAATALAGLGDLPDTLMSRSVVVRMRRRSPTETIEPFRQRVHEPEGNKLRDRVAAWMQLGAPMLADVWPPLPEGLTDRPADVWEPLLAIADLAGDDWPQRARAAALDLTSFVPGDVSLGVRLLSDLVTVFGEDDAIHSGTLLETLNDLDDAPWGDLFGKPLDARGLAKRLRRYGIESRDVWIAGTTKRGYRRDDLWDAWGRYVPGFPTPSHESARSARSARSSEAGTSTPSTPSGPSTPERRGAEPFCAGCALPLDPVLAAAGEATHPACEPT